MLLGVTPGRSYLFVDVEDKRMRVAPSRREKTNADRFNQRYGEGRGDVGRAMALEVFGANIDVNGYTTVAQADRLAAELKLRPGMLLLDVGAGAGWPGLQIAKTTGCSVVLSDQPRPALERALHHASSDRIMRLASRVAPSASSCSGGHRRPKLHRLVSMSGAPTDCGLVHHRFIVAARSHSPQKAVRTQQRHLRLRRDCRHHIRRRR